MFILLLVILSPFTSTTPSLYLCFSLSLTSSLHHRDSSQFFFSHSVHMLFFPYWSACYQMSSIFLLNNCQLASLRSFCMDWLNFTAYTWCLCDFSPGEDVHLQWANQLFSAASFSWQICDPPVSVYKGYAMPKDTEDYLLSCGLKNALYSIRAADLTEDLFGTLVPCPFQVSQYV